MKKGGVGGIVPGRGAGFCLKVVPLLLPDGRENPGFWTEARSYHFYSANIRFMEGCLKCPTAARYWIRQENPEVPRGRRLADLRDAFHVEEIPHFEEYVLAPSGRLEQICFKRQKADLLLTYAIQTGEKSLDSYFRQKMSLSEARHLIGQVLSAILYLYRFGCAHGDVKPANIMVSEAGGQKLFRLTDFGSMDAHGYHSASGTPAYFSQELWQKLIADGIPPLKCRTLMDAHALGVTLYAMAKGRNPRSALLETGVIEACWPELAGVCHKLLSCECSLEELRQIAGEMGGSSAGIRHYRPILISSTRKFYDIDTDFDEICRDDSGISWGNFHEQIAFSGLIDPLMKIPGYVYCWNTSVYEELSDLLLLPLMIIDGMNNNSFTVFHAPDNAVTGRRVRHREDFRNYRPKTEKTADLTDKDRQEIDFARLRLAIFFADDLKQTAVNPKPEDIVCIDGRWKILLRW